MPGKVSNRTTAPTGQIAPFGLRMLPGLKERMEQAARAAGRSMNAEIVQAIEAWLVDHEHQPDERRELAGISTDALLAELRRRCR